MKYIVVGLGSFGSALAVKLTEQGNEVIGIDISMDKVESYKEKISHTICMDATDEFTVSGLPLKDTDMVVIAIGENRGANVMATALFKNMNVKKLVSRAIDSLHEKVLYAIGVHQIVHPEQESAERWAKKLCLKGILDSFELSEEFSIVEINVPTQFYGKTIKDINIRENFNLLILTTMSASEEKNLLGTSKQVFKVHGVADPYYVLHKEDILVVYGAKKDINRFVQSK